MIRTTSPLPARVPARLSRDLLELQGEGEAGAGEDLAGAVEHDGLGQGSAAPPGRDHLARSWPGRVSRLARLAVEVGRHRQRVGADHLLVLLQIGLGDGQRIVERVADPLAEPGLEAELEEDRRRMTATMIAGVTATR